MSPEILDEEYSVVDRIIELSYTQYATYSSSCSSKNLIA